MLIILILAKKYDIKPKDWDMHCIKKVENIYNKVLKDI